MAEFLFQRCQDQPVDEFPDIGYESNRLKVPALVVIAEVIRLDLFVQDNDRLRKNVLPEPAGISRKSAFVDAKNDEADVPQNQLVCSLF